MSPPLLSERLALAALVVAWVVPAWWLGASTVAGQGLALGAGAVALSGAAAARLTAPATPPAAAPARNRHVGTLVVAGGLAAFLALLLCQALNPDRVLVPGRPVGRLLELGHLTWLPAGIEGPFQRLPRDYIHFANAWRHLLVAGAVLLPVAALALLPRRAAPLRTILAALFLHGVLFSAFAFVHNLSGSKAVLWMVTDPSFHLGAPQFMGKNQQAAYQVLLLALALAAWAAPAALRPWPALRHRRLWLGLGTAVVVLGTVTTRSRAGLGAAALLFLAASVFILWPHRRRWRHHRSALLAGAGLALVLGAGLALLPPVRATLVRVAELARHPADLFVGGSYRRILHDIAWQMTLDRPWFGHGAGCYVLLFSTYHPRVPAYMEALRRDHPDTNRPVHTHADGDWIEFTAEYGLVGTALLAAPWTVWLATLARRRPWAPATALLALGPLLVLAHGWIDFVLRNPAILGLAATLALLALSTARPVSPSEAAA